MRLMTLLLLAAATVPAAFAQSRHPRLLDPGTPSGLPRVHPNNNRTPAGTPHDGVLELNLEVAWADWRVETADGPGLRVAAVAAAGHAPTVPAPLIRVETGTQIQARVRNTLRDTTITVFGLHTRPAATPDSLVIAPGETGAVAFEAGAAGTYFYWVRLGDGIALDDGEEEQLAGAFIIDPPGGSPPDRVFVINIFSTPIDTALHAYGWLEALAINGRSWPHTERIRPAVGDTLRWRIINASRRNHPMHLHGFYYDVTALGTPLEDTIYAPEERRTVVTEFMRHRTTMAMEWIPTRPGNWLFHCHLSFHVAPDIRLPGVADADGGHHKNHMAGLVTGIEVQPGPTDLVAHGPPRDLTLHVNQYADAGPDRYGFARAPGFTPDDDHPAVPGPVLVMQQYQTTNVTVQNNMSIPTGVHWHGLELDSWADGVPGWSASDGRMSPVIEPGAAFTYKLSLMRAGTFIYHSHLDDIEQLSGGLYGALLVLPEGASYDPTTDHLYIAGWASPDPQSPQDFVMNGGATLPDQHTVVGQTHRIRVINIAPAGNIAAWMLKDDAPVPLRAVAKDGADLPTHQQVDVARSPRMGVGETADFTFTPAEPGTYEFVVGYQRHQWRQRWTVSATSVARKQ